MRFLLLSILLSAPLYLFAQDSSAILEVLPHFKKCAFGDTEQQQECTRLKLMKYLSKVHYPLRLAELGLCGKTVFGFFVEKDGSLDSVWIEKSSGHQEMDEEVLHHARKMPKWNPGIQRGKAVKVMYSAPVRFRVDAEDCNVLTTPEKEAYYEGCEQLSTDAEKIDCTKEKLAEFASAIKYPKQVLSGKWKGKTKIYFAVDDSGKPYRFEIGRKGFNKKLDKLILEYAKTMPSFTPAEHNGEKAKMLFELWFRYEYSSFAD